MRRSPLTGSLSAAGLLGAVALASAAPAGAATLTLGPARAVAGARVAVAAGGFATRAPISVRAGRRLVTLSRTDRRGRATLRFRVSKRRRPGRLTLTVGTHRRRFTVVLGIVGGRTSPDVSLTTGPPSLQALLAPVRAAGTTSRHVFSWGWAPRSRVTLTLGGKALRRTTASGAGKVSFRLALATSPGSGALVLSARGRRLAVPFTTKRPADARTKTTPSGTTPTTTTPTTTTPTTTTPTTTTPTPTTTTPTQPPPAPVTVAAAGDIACPAGDAVTSNACRQASTADVVAAMDPDAVLPVGDTQYETGALSDFQGSWAPTWGRFDSIGYPVPGDNEYESDPAATGYFDYFDGVGENTGRAGVRGQGYYAYTLGSWRVYALNTNDSCTDVSCGPGSPQETWLRAQLAAHPGGCQLAYWHQPLFNSGNAYLPDTSSVPFKTALKTIWADLENAGVDVVLNGHDHHYERFAPQDANGDPDANGPREFIVGTGGRNHANPPASPAANSEVRNYTTFGALRLTLGAGTYQWKFMPEAGKTFTDSGSGACH